MNAQIDPDRVSILKNVTEIRANWTPDERRQRANAARKYSRMLLRMISEADECEDVWAVGAPSDVDFGRLAVVQ